MSMESRDKNKKFGGGWDNYIYKVSHSNFLRFRAVVGHISRHS